MRCILSEYMYSHLLVCSWNFVSEITLMCLSQIPLEVSFSPMSSILAMLHERIFFNMHFVHYIHFSLTESRVQIFELHQSLSKFIQHPRLTRLTEKRADVNCRVKRRR